MSSPVFDTPGALDIIHDHHQCSEHRFETYAHSSGLCRPPALNLTLWSFSMTSAERVPFQCLSAVEAAALLRNESEIHTFDVRDMHSFQQEHVEGAMQLTEDRVPLWVGKIARTTPVLIYCYHGNASKTFAQMFSDFRFQRVYSVDGGYRPLANAIAGNTDG